MKAYREAVTFREIDEQLGLRKGDSFRMFKRLEDQLQEHQDYIVLRAGEDAETIALLRQTGRIYHGSINVVLLAPEAQKMLLARLQRVLDARLQPRDLPR